MPDPAPADHLAWAICATVLPERDDDGERPCRVPCAACRAGAAAVIRVIADQVVPVSTEPNRTINVQPEQDVVFIGAWHIWNTQSKMRSQLLAKAAKLEVPHV